MRQIVLDTETTGLEADRGHRIIEIGGVEVINRRLTGRHFHKYLNPERDIDAGAQQVHGLSKEFLADKPKFADVVEEFVAFVLDAELVIHNAPFDVTFLDHELMLLPRVARENINTRLRGRKPFIERLCSVTDSLAVARHRHPGQKNNLDALCRRYDVDNSTRQLHGALLDAEILADVYLRMTGGQTALFAMDSDSGEAAEAQVQGEHWEVPQGLVVVAATPAELQAHEAVLDLLDAQSASGAVWRSASS